MVRFRNGVRESIRAPIGAQACNICRAPWIRRKYLTVAGWYSFRMIDLLWQKAAQRVAPRSGQSFTAWFRHLGAAGLFFLAILDSSPLPTFGGPDILTAILAASHRNAWYEFAVVATAGSAIGAYFTFRLAQTAGAAYLNSKFKKSRVTKILKLFEQRGAGALFASTAIPFPFPTSMLFAAAGVSNYRTGKFLGIVIAGRAIRYSAIALVANLYGRHFIRMLRHPSQYWQWSVLFVVLVIGFAVGGILLNRRLVTAAAE
jgi:membrane protein YqaA with SNARE-associated domain